MLTLGSFFFAWIADAIRSSLVAAGYPPFSVHSEKNLDSDGFLKKVMDQRHLLVTSLEPAEAFAFGECFAAYQGLERSFWSLAGDDP